MKSLNHYAFGDSRGNLVDMLGVRDKEAGVLRATFIVDSATPSSTCRRTT